MCVEAICQTVEHLGSNPSRSIREVVMMLEKTYSKIGMSFLVSIFVIFFVILFIHLVTLK